MGINIETAIRWMSDRENRVTYSMDYRNGPNSYDCSSSVYYALMSAGALTAGWAVNTEYQHDWLIKNGYELIAENTSWNAQRGDIFIWGQRGYSSGAGGHTGIFIDGENIIHCNYARNSITIDNYNQTAAASGWMYWYAYRLKNNSEYNQVKSIEVLAQEVIAGKHGSGNQRKASLGSQFDEVQAKVNELLKQPKVEPKLDEVKKEEGDLSLNGAILKKSILDIILDKCNEHNILPSYVITILHFEGLWGTSAVGKADNNWGGMTWTGKGDRPSGITVTQGTARPTNEGGHYMHYASVNDFLTDWFYLLRKDGIYKVSGAKTFSEAIKGMFQIGGAKYDYAASGYEDYLVGASSRLKAIEKENGVLDKYDQFVITDEITPDNIDVNVSGIEVTINGEVYQLTKKPV